jgi:NitT/TauT family transport system permease protein
MSRLSAFGLPVLGAVVLVAIYWAITIVFNVKAILMPTPPSIVKSFNSFFGYLMDMSRVTLVETLAGFAIAAGGGLVIALILTSSETVNRATLPLLVAANAIPKVALAPLLVVWLGFGYSPKISLAVLICFFPIIVSTMSGLTSTPADLGELANSLSASRWQTFVKVRLPWALPQIFVGLKAAIPLAVTGAVVGEINGSADKGLGYVIVASGSTADTALAFSSLVLLAVMSIALFYLVVGVERLLLPWARETSA